MPIQPSDEITYASRPRLIGPGSRFRLSGGVLEWQVGARSGTLRMADVSEVRLSFQPGQLGSPNYQMRLRGREGTLLKVGSLSRTAITGVEDNRAAYSGFVRAVHEALRGGKDVRYVAGLPVWRWWLMAALAAVTACGLVGVLVSTLVNSQWTAAALLAVLCPVLGWPLAELLWRNRPAPYAPPDLPPRLIPG